MNKIKELRKEKNLTISELSQALGIPKTTLNNYENGKRIPRDQETWQRIANYFNVSVAYLMGLDNSFQNSNVDYGKAFKFVRSLYDMDIDNFSELINGHLKLTKGEKSITPKDLEKIENGEIVPSEMTIAVIASYLGIDYSDLKAGKLYRKYDRTKVQGILENMGQPIKKKSLDNLLKAIQDTQIVNYDIAEILQMYSYNLIYDNKISDKSSLIDYFEEKQKGLLQAENNEYIPMEIRMDISLEVSRITEILKRISLYDSITK